MSYFVDHWRVPSFLQIPVRVPAPIRKGKGLARMRGLFSGDAARSCGIGFLRPGYLRSSVLLWKHLFLLSYIRSCVRRYVNLYLDFMRHLRVRGRHLFRFISGSIGSSKRSYHFRGYLRHSRVLWRHLFLFFKRFIFPLSLFLYRLNVSGECPSDGISPCLSSGVFPLGSRAGKGHMHYRAAIRIRNYLFGGHLVAVILRSLAVYRETVSLLKKRMHRQGRTCGSCACRNGSDQVVRSRIGLTHKPCFKGIRFSKLAHIFALL